MKRVIPVLLLAIVLCSHDMFLKLDTFFLQPNTDSTIQLLNGTFERSENVIDRNRMLDVSLVMNGQRSKADSSQWFEKDSITYLRFNTGEEGTYVAGVSTATRNIEMDGEAFNSYLEHDGVLDELEWRKENNAMDKAALERYSKHVKTIFQVGESLSDDWNTVLGYPIEFVPLENPYDIHPGHELQVKLLWGGQPLANQLVYVGNDGSGAEHSHEAEAGEHTHDDGTTHSHDEPEEHTHDDGTTHTHDEPEVHTHDDGTTHSHEETEEHTHDDGTTHSHDEEGGEEHEHTGIMSLRTDSEGIVSVPLSSTGVWYLRTIYMEQISEEGLTHESNWATLTFAIGEGHPHEHEDEAHSHEEEGIPSYVFWIGSFILVGILFFWFNRKK
ncbi:DUF4198 domain-containing protein [Algoriphagus namhaensis]|uniref:DUF4198 domain-containing protein n=1 Tax=Algoriphagus namhaensis TaxID=915353 RepID=A0ABV8AST4_9BACT